VLVLVLVQQGTPLPGRALVARVTGQAFAPLCMVMDKVRDDEDFDHYHE
jgi:hypothetical protein